MNKNIQFKKIIIIIIILSCNIFCNKMKYELQRQLPNKISGILLSGDSSSVYGYVLLSSNQTGDWGVDSNFQISATAVLTDSVNNNVIKMTSVSINSRTLNSSADSSFSFNYTDSSGTVAEGKALAGTNVKVKLTGSSLADTVTQNIYMPKNVMRQTKDFPPGILDASNNLTLHWITDGSNPTNNVIIKIFYYEGLSHLKDSTLPSHISTLTYNVTDNGSYTISSSDLSVFPSNSFVGIEIGRGTQLQAVLPVSQRRLFFWTISSVSSIPLWVVYS